MTAVLELRIIWTHEERGEMEMDLMRIDKKIQLKRPTCCALLSKTDKGKRQFLHKSNITSNPMTGV